MSDLFHPDVDETFIRQVFDVMVECPRHTFQILTKRSERLAELAPRLPWLPHMWMGVSVESEDEVQRIDLLQPPHRTQRARAAGLILLSVIR